MVERTPFADCETLRLARVSSGAPAACALLTPFDRPQPLVRSPSIAVLRPRRWLHTLRRAAARAYPVGGLTAAASSGVDLLPYQLEPALAMIRMGVARVMIADAVGLGKTIQAALVLAQLARRDSFRGLVIVPAGLREQWAAELAARFALETTSADAAWLERLARDLPAEVNPWILPGIYLSSYDFIKRPEVLQPLETLDWDIVIIDEAHNASPGTARRAAVHAAAVRASRVLLLTATPHSGDADDFNALCGIGDADGSSRPVMVFQRSRADVGASTVRRTVVLPVALTTTEERMHRLLDDYTARLCREAGRHGDSHARLAAIVLKKRGLSSAGSLAASARRRLALLAQAPAAPIGYQPELPLEPAEDSGTDAADAPPDTILSAPGLEDAGRERRWLAAIAECAENASRRESKTRLLLRLLGRMRQPVIVFTEFRDTLERLQAAVRAEGHEVRLLHGGLPQDERVASQRAFADCGGVLLATDAAAEGLNLQHGCRVVIHYELPWSPARLEQRTGRVDRIGQERRVHELLLVAADTAERLVLAPLARRAARARTAGPSFCRLFDVLSESRVASAVMEGKPLKEEEKKEEESKGPVSLRTPAIARALPAPAALRDEAHVEAARLGEQRTSLSTPGTYRSSPGLVATAIRMRGTALPPGLLCIYTISLCSPDGVVVHRRVACGHEAWATSIFQRQAASVRRLAEDFLRQREAAVRAAVLAAYAGELDAAATIREAALDAMAQREHAMAGARPAAARELVQAGLFDGRALRALEARRLVSATLLDASEDRLRSLAESRSLATTTELTAVLIVSGARR
jgi:superfamily II DNA or RNA helicase